MTTSLPTPTSVPFFVFLSVVRRKTFFHHFACFSHSNGICLSILTAFVSLALALAPALALSQVVIDTIDDLESVLHLISWE